MKYFLGINSSFHDSSLCLLSDSSSEPLLYLSEDRHSGIPHHTGIPYESIDIMKKNYDIAKVESIYYSRDKYKFLYPHESYFNDLLLSSSDELSIRNALKNYLDRDDHNINLLIKCINSFEKKTSDFKSLRKRICYLINKYQNENMIESKLSEIFQGIPIYGLAHHTAHAYQALFSKFNKSLVITWDGRGEFQSTGLYHLDRVTKGQPEISQLVGIDHPRSLGAFYNLFVEYCGFNRVSGPGKLMGLAAYGEMTNKYFYDDLILVDENKFDFTYNEKWIISNQSEPLSFTQEAINLIGPKYVNDFSQQIKNIAYGAQYSLEVAAKKLISNAVRVYGSKNVFISGGVALNCVMNAKLLDLDINLDVFPASGDDGTAIGCAAYAKSKYIESAVKEKYSYDFNSHYGTDTNKSEFIKYAQSKNLVFKKCDTENILEVLERGGPIGVMRGRYEIGPRALGNRSIIALPFKKSTWPYINQKVKFREDFRPFAPMVLEEDFKRILSSNINCDESPYMLLAPKLSEEFRKALGAVSHVDGTARIQTISSKNPFYYGLLKAIKYKYGIGSCLNTSLNMAGESIINDHVSLVNFLALSELAGIIYDDLMILKSENLDQLNLISEEIGSREKYLELRSEAYSIKYDQLNLDAYDDTFFKLFGECLS